MSKAANEQRHPTLYKTTGDLVISATTGETTHLFRVHTVILAEHSPVFAGMLTLPKGPGVDMQTYDGVPVVHLPDDAKDVTSLLQLLYSPGSPISKKERTFAADVYGLMSMARKYQLDSVCATISQSLQEQWPSTLTAFLQARAEAKEMPMGPFNSTARIPPDPASVIRLAIDFDIPSVLPAAYYALSTYDISAPPYALTACPWPRWDLLRPEELLRYYQGKLQLSRKFSLTSSELYNTLYDDDYDACDAPVEDHDWDEQDIAESSKCRQILANALISYAAGYPSLRSSYEAIARADPIHALMEIYERPSSAQLCMSCYEVFKSRCRKRIENLWENLPRTFSLGGPHHAPVPADQL